MEKSWPANLESIPQILEFAYSYAMDMGLTARKARQLKLAIEEISVNIVRYAVSDDQKAEIKITLERFPSKVIIQVTDTGPPFNPLEVAAPRIDAPVHERPIGGLGIFLAKKMLDEMDYQRVGNRNILTMEKLL
jgi:serine/threonine-protein kinase RsbW